MTDGFEFFGEKRLFHGSVPRIMGTRLDFILFGEEKDAAVKLWEESCAEAELLDGILNRFDPRSEVGRFNASYDESPFRASAVLLDILRVSMDYCSRTGGLFDVTRGKADCLSCSGDVIQKFDPELDLDFGGIAKGYFMDHLQSRLMAAGVKCAFVNFGESAILAIGKHPFGDSWQVSVPNPFGWQSVMKADLVDCAFSTSGNMPGSMGHIINPLTREPVMGRRLACVQGPRPLDAEVLSTVLLIADEEQRKGLQESFRNVKMEIYDL